MKISRTRLRRIIREERDRLVREQAAHPGAGSATGDDISDEVLRKALEIFPDAIIDENMGEVYIDTGLADSEVEAMYDEWIVVWPDAEMDEGGLIYTGVQL